MGGEEQNVKIMKINISEFEIPKSMFPIYTAVIGEVIMRGSIALTKVNDLEFEGYIETPMYGRGKYLIGRKLLKKINIVLLGREKKLCYLENV